MCPPLHALPLTRTASLRRRRQLVVPLSAKAVAALHAEFGADNVQLLHSLVACPTCTVRSPIIHTSMRCLCRTRTTQHTCRAHARAPHATTLLPVRPPPLPLDTPASSPQREAEALARQRQEEQDRVFKADPVNEVDAVADEGPGALPWFIISSDWLAQWNNFIYNGAPPPTPLVPVPVPAVSVLRHVTRVGVRVRVLAVRVSDAWADTPRRDGSGRGAPRPGPVSNHTLLDEAGNPKPDLVKVTHYRGVNKLVRRPATHTRTRSHAHTTHVHACLR